MTTPSKGGAGEGIRVVCRFRPFNKLEAANGSFRCVTINEDRTAVRIKAESDLTFNFDRLFDEENSQAQVYDDAARPVVDDIMTGYNGTIFVYGQTGAGKTHTMQGPSIDDKELRGIIPRMIEQVFEGIANADENIEFLVKASYIEIYMEKIRDLLDARRDNLKVREEKGKGIWVDGATEVYITSEKDVHEVIRTGMSNRAIAATRMNAESSRSHSVFILYIQQKSLKEGSVKTGKLYLVDLAGSEKVEKTGASGTTLDEAKMINKSLSALGNVINALTDGKSAHIPYRDSKLTRILQESLGGNSRTTLVINCSPSSYNEAETISTLRFGTRAKTVKNKAKINKEMSAAELKLLLAKAEAEIEKLKLYIRSLEEEMGKPPTGGTPARPQTAAASTSSSSSSPAAAPAKGAGKTSNAAAIQGRIDELEARLAAEEEEKKTLQEQVDNIQDSVSEKDSELQAQFEVMSAMKEDLGRYTQEAQALTKENSQLSIDLAEAKLAHDKVKYETTSKGLEVDSLKEQLAALQAEFDDFKTQAAQVQPSTLSEPSHPAPPPTVSPTMGGTIVPSMREQWDHQEQELQRMLNEGDRMEHERETQARIEEMQATISSLESKNRVKAGEEEVMQDTIKTLEGRCVTLAKDGQAKGTALTKAEERLQRAEERIHELMEAQAQALASIEALKARPASPNVSAEKGPADEPTNIVESPNGEVTTDTLANQTEHSETPREKELATQVAEMERQLAESTGRLTTLTQQLQTYEARSTEAETQLATQGGEIERLLGETSSQKAHMASLHQECAKLEQTIKTMSAHTPSTPSGSTSPRTHGPTAEDSPHVKKMEGELKQLREETRKKLEDFATVKEALLQDLENRCQKVVELEILLDTAQDKYVGLVAQMKKSGGKGSHDMQKKLDEATTARHQMALENNKLRLENQAALKQLALRDEHIYSLETLLQETQIRFHKLNVRYEATAEELAKVKSDHEALNTSGGIMMGMAGMRGRGGSGGESMMAPRIAKPLRGGGGHRATSPLVGTPSTPSPIFGTPSSGISVVPSPISPYSIGQPSAPAGSGGFKGTAGNFKPVTVVPATPETPASGSGKKSSFWDIFDWKSPNTPKRDGKETPSSPSQIPSTPLPPTTPLSAVSPISPIAPIPLQPFSSPAAPSPSGSYAPAVPTAGSSSYAPAVPTASAKPPPK
eukprot:TRINITY_DN4179_c0_g1_i4.p1 TRINITY_DN4179_c0_g1~~TRINITY_DN4179_c0_g1_i4.p1  ORF type:complete len:1189 (-),score=408.18 TRINITY_DN4179_c0_g1_i4:28-3594(-)